MRFLQIIALAAVTACASAATRPATDAPGARLYVVNQSSASITVIDQQRLTVDTTIDLTRLGFSLNAKPHHVVVERDGSAWYATLIGDGKVLKFNRANRLVGQVSMETPGLLSIDPVHDTLFVGRSMTAPNPPRSLAVIARTAFSLVSEEEIQIPRPHALVTTRDGRWTHAASLAENRIASLDAITGRVTFTTLPGAFRSMVQFTISPDGRWLVIGGELSNTVLLFDLDAPPPLVPVKEFVVHGKPWDPAFSPDGARVYFSLFGDNAIAEIDLATARETRRFSTGFAQPYDIIMRADGKYLFVVNQNTGATPKAGESAHDHMNMTGTDAKNGWLSVIDVATGSTIKSLMLGAGPTGAGAAGAR